MNGISWSHIDPASRVCVLRCVLRLVLVLGLSVFSTDFVAAFWLFSLLSAIICGLYGASVSEKLFAPSLNHWDEAFVFLLISQLTHRLAG